MGNIYTCATATQIVGITEEYSFLVSDNILPVSENIALRTQIFIIAIF